MFSELDIFKNTENKPNRIKTDWQNEDKLMCSFDLQLGLGRKVHWPTTNPVSLLNMVQLINKISSWPRKNIQLPLKHFLLGQVFFSTTNESDHLTISLKDKVLYTGSIPFDEIQKLRLTMLNLLLGCQKELRNKYAEMIFRSENLTTDSARYMYGDKVSTVLGPSVKTFKVGNIREVIQKGTGTKYTLLVDGLPDPREYSFDELALQE